MPDGGDEPGRTGLDVVAGLPLSPRILVALGATVIALIVLGVVSLTGGSGDDRTDSTTTTVTTSPTVPVPAGPPRSIDLQPDWYQKGHSLYSERGPTPTVSSLPPTTEDSESGGGDSSGSSGSSGSGSGGGTGRGQGSGSGSSNGTT
ncbi:MAG: hypothetical protein ACOYML_08160 [Microthrixaceae bacterium]